MDELSFYSPAINGVVQNLDAALQMYQRRLDLMAEDIQKLEDFLRSRNLPTDLCVELTSPQLSQQAFRYLSWTSVDGRYRLICLGSDHKSFLPLTDVAVEQRLEFYALLPELLVQIESKVAEHCKLLPPVPEIETPISNHYASTSSINKHLKSMVASNLSY